MNYFHRVGTEFLLGFVTLLSIINPLGISFVFFDMSHWLSQAERTSLARRISVYSFIVILASLITGSTILAFFGISLSALRIAGGLSVAAAGWTMLNAVPVHAREHREAMDTAPVTEMAFFPFTVPLTTGPGTIAAAIALGANEFVIRNASGFGLAALLVSVTVSLIIFLTYSHASTVAGWIGAEGTRVVTRLSAFLLLCVGVQIMLTGVVDVLHPPISLG